MQKRLRRELKREASRVEAIITVVRILGGENEALDKKHPHSFKDTDSWMDPYVGYALKRHHKRRLRNKICTK